MANTKIIILKNTTISDIGIAGLLIPASGQSDFSSIPVNDLFDDPILPTLIASGDIVVNNGTLDLSAIGGDTHIRRDAQHAVWGTPYTDADQQLVDLPLGFNQSFFMSNGTASPPSWEWSRLRIKDNGVAAPGMPYDLLDFVGPLTITNPTGKTGVITFSEEFQRTAVNSTTYTIVPADTFIGVQHTTIAAVTITLPLGSSVSLGRKISIKDEGGNASINNITVNRSGSDTIDGDTGFIFSIDHGAIHVQWTGFEWSII